MSHPCGATRPAGRFGVQEQHPARPRGFGTPRPKPVWFCTQTASQVTISTRATKREITRPLSRCGRPSAIKTWFLDVGIIWTETDVTLQDTHRASNEAGKYQPKYSQAVVGRHDVCYAGFNFAASPLPGAVLPTAKNHITFWLTWIHI